MNKILLIVLILLALGLIAYNVTIVDFAQPLEGDSLIALIGIAAALCAIVLLLIYNTSRKIQKKIDEDR
jgi:ABC-type antimicrobial peptide transport system permease subunit